MKYWNTKSKYNAKKVEIDGHKFDSIKESRRYEELKILEHAGHIKDLVLQPKFELQTSFRKNGKLYRSITYIADFQYFDLTQNKTIIEDVKSKATKQRYMKLKRNFLRRNIQI